MKLVLKSKGTAKLPPDKMITHITIQVKSKNIEVCTDNLIKSIGNTTEFLKSLNLTKDDIVFENYSVTEQKKRIDWTDASGYKQSRYEFDHYLGLSNIEVHYELNFELLEKIQDYCNECSTDKQNMDFANLMQDNNSINFKVDTIYTLNDESFSKLKSMATNNALDQMELQAINIGEHLDLTEIKLKEVNFVEAPHNREDMAFAKARMGASVVDNTNYSISDLDKLLNLKDIVLSEDLYSEWELLEKN